MIKLDCRNSGYTDPKNCTRCRCPAGLQGPHCTKPARTATKCGRTFLTVDRNTATQRIEFNGRGNCNFMVQAGAGHTVRLQWEKLQAFESSPCINNYVEVKVGFVFTFLWIV